MYQHYNPNPDANKVGDCAIRALSKALDREWEETYLDVIIYGLIMHDMPSANVVWGRCLYDHGFKKKLLPDKCLFCYTVRDFAEEHKTGTFVIVVKNHVVCCKDGNYYDSWDSGDEIPLYYWQKEE